MRNRLNNVSTFVGSASIRPRTLLGLSGAPIRSIALLVCACAAPAGYGQVSTAAIHGTVADTSGASIPGAVVTATQTNTNYTTSTKTRDDGSFNLPALPVGPYSIRIAGTGFAGYEQTGLVLEVGQNVLLPVSLRVGAVSEQVVVSAETPAIDSTSPTIQQVVDQRTVSELPLNGRNPATLINTVPGVTDASINISAQQTNSTVRTAVANLPSQSAPTVNGVRPGGTYFSLDGAGNTDPFNVIGGPFPNPDATQEFGVVTGTYGARYVSAPGGAVNVISRSGGNQLHGTIFEFIRNGAVNATNRFATSADPLKRNQYGFAVGGPIIKDKLFFFGSLQETALRSRALINTFVGSAAEQAGQFTQLSTGKTIQVPIGKFAANVFKYIPAPNTGTNLFVGSTPYKSNEPQGTAKLDYSWGNNRLFIRYFTDQIAVTGQPMVNNNIYTATQGQSQSWSNYAIGDTWSSKGGRWILDGRASKIHVKSTNLANSSLAALSGNALGSNISPGIHPTFPLIYAGSLFLQGTTQSSIPRDSWDYNVDVTHVYKKHQISFGGNLRFVSLQQSNEAQEAPAYIYFGTYSNIFYGALSNNNYADFLIGHPVQFSQQDGSFSTVKGKLLGFYGEDKYNATDRLTVTFGLRYDPFLPFAPQAGQIDCFIPGQQSKVFVNAPVGLTYPGDPGCSAGGTSAKFSQIEPRVGVAYKLDERGDTAVRAGFGIYTSQFQLQSLAGFSAPPFNRSFTITNPFQTDTDPYGSNGLTNPFASGFQTASYVPPANVSFATPVKAGFNVSAIDPNFVPSYTEQWSLSLQHAFSPSNSMELAYVGTQGIHIAQTYDANVPVASSTATVSNERARRPYGAEGLLQIRTLRSNSTSNYHGLNATFRHQDKRGLSLYGGFNWSKCLDDGSQPASTLYLTAEGNDPSIRRGRCDYDQNLSFRSTIAWNSPALKGSNNLIRTIAGSWIVSGLVIADAGQPQSVLDSSDPSATGIGLDIADRVPGQPVFLNGRVNKAAFTHPAVGAYGNSGRNSLRSPGYTDFDTAIAKSFHLTPERVSLNLRFEAFNVLNHPNLTPTVLQYNGSASVFGVYTIARDPRILQAAAKLTF